MKKYLFLAVAATAMMASCSNDEVVEMAQGEAIAFDNAFIDKSTRSIDPSITTETLNEFKVYGCVAGQSYSIKSSMLHNRTWASCSKVSAAALLMFFARISYC